MKLCGKPSAEMANPRKFSEKIALHNQKQAEETAAFEQIMREVGVAVPKVGGSTSPSPNNFVLTIHNQIYSSMLSYYCSLFHFVDRVPGTWCNYVCSCFSFLCHLVAVNLSSIDAGAVADDIPSIIICISSGMFKY